MKKISTMLLSVALLVAGATSFTSCDIIDEAVDMLGFGDNTEYVGSVTVSKLGINISEEDNKTFRADIEDNQISIDMVDVKLFEELPAMTLKLNDMPLDDESFSASEVTPVLVVAEIKSLTCSDIKGTIDEDDLEMSFVCTYRSESLGQDISVDIKFEGDVKK